MLPTRALRKVLLTLPRISLPGPWYRAVNYDHLGGPRPGFPAGGAVPPLWAGGPARKGARFTPRAVAAGATGSPVSGIDCLYLAEDELTPLLEIASVLRPRGSRLPLRFEPQVIMAVDGALSDVLDLTQAATQLALGTTLAELTAPWILQQANHLAGLAPLPPTQALGEAAFAAGSIAALRYPSSKNPAGVGLVVFTIRLVAGRDSLNLFNHSTGRLQQSLP